jgi:hypothetical protein
VKKTSLNETVLTIAELVIVITMTGFATYLIAMRFLRKKPNLNIDLTKNISSYKIRLYRKIGDSYVEVDEKNVKPKEGKFRVDNKDFGAFDKEKIAFTDKKHKYYAFDYDSGSQLFFSPKELPETVSIDDIDNYVNKGIISQILKGLEKLKDDKKIYINLILGIVIGAVMGFAIGYALIPQINKPIETTKFILSLMGVA